VSKETYYILPCVQRLRLLTDVHECVCRRKMRHSSPNATSPLLQDRD
jgi:hypothetical protein